MDLKNGSRVLSGVLLLAPAVTEAQLQPLDEALFEAVEKGQEPRVRNLISDGANVNAVDGSGRSPLMRAVAGSRVGIAVALLDAEADPRYRFTCSRSVFDIAIGSGSLPIVRLLASKAPDLLRPTDDPYGLCKEEERRPWRPVDVASWSVRSAIVEWLLEQQLPPHQAVIHVVEAAGADPQRDQSELAAAQIRIISSLYNSGADTEAEASLRALFFSVEAERADLVIALLNAGVSANAIGSAGRLQRRQRLSTCLLPLCELLTRLSSLRSSRRKAIHCTRISLATHLFTPLPAQRMRPSWRCSSRGLENAQVDARNALGETPLMHAADRPSVLAMVGAGAEVDAQDASGRTFLRRIVAGHNLAAIGGISVPDMVQLLLGK